VSPRGATFELERFSVSPVTAGVVLLEVQGRLAGSPARTAAPRMLVEPPSGARREHAPVDAATHDGLLRASFALAAADVEASDLALAVGGLLLDLPAPDPVSVADRAISLSREVNVLRHELTALHDEVAKGREAATDHAAKLERQERAAAEREAAADQMATARIEEVERAASQRQADAARAATERQAELERSASEIGQVLADERAATEERDAAAAAERARLQAELDAARDEATTANARAARRSREQRAARAELETLRRTLDRGEQALHPAAPASRPRVRATPSAPAEDPVTTAVHAADDEKTTVEIPSEDDTTVNRPADDEAAGSVAPPDDTGPIPLRRGPSRRGSVGPIDSADGAQSESVRVLGRDRPRASALPPPPGPSPRALALAALALAALLVLVAILGFLL
jgi:hypothetical protein